VVEDVVVKKFTFAISSPDEFPVHIGCCKDVELTRDCLDQNITKHH